MRRNKTSRLHGGVWMSIILIASMTLLAILAPVIAPYDPTQMRVKVLNYPPAWYKTTTTAGSQEFLLGTDMFGRDILSHVIHGARAAMFLVLVAIPITVLLGTVIGISAGLGNQILESIFLRSTDVISSVPAIMFAVILVLILRATPLGMLYGGLITMTLAFALVNWVSLARLLYSSVKSMKHYEFMEAARSLGANTSHQIINHILPHISHLITVWVVNNIPALILLEALLGYIGVQILQVADGSSFQDLSWGGLILIGRTQINRNPFMLFAPTICILVISMSFSVLGEYLNERLNPKLDSNQIL